MQDAVDVAHEVLIGAAAEGDEELEMKYLEEETLDSTRSAAASLRAPRGQARSGPLRFGAARVRVSTLLDFIANNAPSPQGTTETVVDGDGERPGEITQDAPFSALVWKTSIDQFSGKLSYIKTMTGVLSHETELYNVREQKKDRVRQALHRDRQEAR
jgi:elongation factor G